MRNTLKLVVLGERLSICQVGPGEEMPAWATGGSFVSVTSTPEELSIVCPTAGVPEDVRRSDGWRALRADGQFDFSECGVLASITSPLAANNVPVLAICTFNTDYVLVRDCDLNRGIESLEREGHEVVRAESDA